MTAMPTSSGSHCMPDEHAYEGVLYSGVFPARVLDKIKVLQFDDNDVIVAAYPKSGTNWVCELIHMLKTVKSTEDVYKPRDKSPSLIEMVAPDPAFKAFIDNMENREKPWLLKTHLRPSFYRQTLENSKTKFVVVMRNIRDVLVSYYHFYMSQAGLGYYQGSFDEWFELVKDDWHVNNGSWLEMNLQWWKQRHNANVYILKYEDCIHDLASEIRKLAAFLRIDVADETIEILTDAGTFKSMKENPEFHVTRSPGSKSPFMRKGQVGDWRNHMSAGQRELIDSLVKQPLTDAGLIFDYE